MTTSDPTATAGRPAARITLDGATARRFRRELLGEYALAADTTRQCLSNLNDIDFDDLERWKHRLAELDEILVLVGWSREIDDGESVEIVGNADLLAEIVRTFIAGGAQQLSEVAESGDRDGLDEVIDAYGDVERWYKILGKLTATSEAGHEH